MAVHHRFGLRHFLVNLHVHQNFAGARFAAGQLIPLQVDQTHILGAEVVLADQGGGADHLVGAEAIGNVTAVAIHELAHPELSAHSADLFLDSFGFRRIE